NGRSFGRTDNATGQARESIGALIFHTSWAGTLSFGERAGMYALAQDKARSHAAHNSRCSRQGESLPNAIRGFDASAMCAHQIRHFELFHLVGRPIQLLIRCRKELETLCMCWYPAMELS